MKEIISISHLSFTYPDREEAALLDLSLKVEEGELLVLCGPSGSGKSTLLRQLKPVLRPHGALSGSIRFAGRELEGLSPEEQAVCIGAVQQSPEDQVVTDQVWHELAFGLESLGEDTPVIRRKVAETASFFGIDGWFHRNVNSLSGGEKQLLSLASVMVMGPQVLLLDEPTAQLDPIAAEDFLNVLARVNRELGTTILLAEHRLETALALADRAAVLDRGRLLCTGTPAEVGRQLRRQHHAMFLAMPAPVRIWAAAAEEEGSCPVTVREGRIWLEDFSQKHPLGDLPPERVPPHGGPVLTAEELWFRYARDREAVVRGLSLTLHYGELLALMGGNGAGKTTALRLLAGLLPPERGAVSCRGRLALLPQDPRTLLNRRTVRDELTAQLSGADLTRQEGAEQLSRVVRLCRLEGLLDRHPYDLSGGEQQRTALAKVLLPEPEVLLLDEPTKGLDADFKAELGALLTRLTEAGKAVLLVSHDVEFCAEYAHRCGLFFDGGVVSDGTPREFFTGSRFYTTAASRMSRALLPDAVTVREVIAACGGTAPPEPECPQYTDTIPLSPPKEKQSGGVREPLPRWRKAAALCSGAAALALFVRIIKTADLTALVGLDGVTAQGLAQLPLSFGFLLALTALALSLGRRSRPESLPPPERKRLDRRTKAAAGLILLLIPLTLYVGTVCFSGRRYYMIALLILLESMIPFFLIFEGRRPQARELVLTASLCGIAVAGRGALFMLPQCKPVTALTIVAGAALGGETGFLVGAVSMLASNVFYGQGAWTPWQMFAMGIIGFLAGVLFQRGWLRRSRGSLSVFGALAALVIYGGIMDPASVLMWSGALNGKLLLAAYVTGLPLNCIHALSTALFLWFAGEPMLDRLDRVKRKYGIAE